MQIIESFTQKSPFSFSISFLDVDLRPPIPMLLFFFFSILYRVKNRVRHTYSQVAKEKVLQKSEWVIKIEQN